MARASNAAFRAMADGTRREILVLLRHRSRTSGEIAGHFNSSWPTISRHLAVLRDANLVNAERCGQEIHYELNTSVFEDLIQHVMTWTKGPRMNRPARAEQAQRTQRARQSEG